MCDDIHELVDDLQRQHIPREEVYEAEWGWLTLITLPGDGELGIYQPRHARPEARGTE